MHKKPLPYYNDSKHQQSDFFRSGSENLQHNFDSMRHVAVTGTKILRNGDVQFSVKEATYLEFPETKIIDSSSQDSF